MLFTSNPDLYCYISIILTHTQKKIMFFYHHFLNNAELHDLTSCWSSIKADLPYNKSQIKEHLPIVFF